MDVLDHEPVGAEASVPGETWGVGYYAEERALIIRKPAELLATRTVYELASNVQSSVVLACVHRGAETREQAPPHRFRSWLFGYTGDLAPLQPLRELGLGHDLFLADHPVTGGYPVIAVVLDGDIDLAAQARPGQRLHFRLEASR